MKEIVVLVGPAGSGKSTLCFEFPNHVRVSQDDFGKEGHFKVFELALESQQNIIIDRMNFSREQRERYLAPARAAGYTTRIIILHVPKNTCLERCNSRTQHPTIKTPQDASKALDFFFRKYERVEDTEADIVERRGWEGAKETVVISDLDSTLANLNHRLHYVQGVDNISQRKKDWKSFFEESIKDTPYQWCKSILEYMPHKIIIATARPENYRNITTRWLKDNFINYQDIIMRGRNDFRQDNIVKEIMLEWEIKTKYNVLFWLDDRSSVINTIRSHGITVLDCCGRDF
jgi:predicted kinase